MKLPALLVVVIVLSGSAVPALGDGLLLGLLAGCDQLDTLLPVKGVTRLDRASLHDPANIGTDSAVVICEYVAENLVRTRTNGKLTADVTGSGKAESLFIPLHIAKQPSTLALSHASLGANASYENLQGGARLKWHSHSNCWALNHSFGVTRIGIMSSQRSDHAPGTSTYPSELFSLFSSWTPVSFAARSRERLIQISRPISRSSEISLSAGTVGTNLRTTLGQNGNDISFPFKADTTQYELDVKTRVSSRLHALAGYSCSNGSGSNSIYRNGSTAGTLDYRPQYRQLSASLRYLRKPSSVWQMGFVSSDWDLGLRGTSIRGSRLGIKLEPFSDYIDFNADARLSIDFLHVGMQRQVSDRWSLGWRYKLARVKSEVNADYVGRAFFGFINVSGNYNLPVLATLLHDMELSAQYALKKVAFEMRIEQLVPSNSRRYASNSGPSPSAGHSRSTGGTTVSLTSSYTF